MKKKKGESSGREIWKTNKEKKGIYFLKWWTCILVFFFFFFWWRRPSKEIKEAQIFFRARYPLIFIEIVWKERKKRANKRTNERAKDMCTLYFFAESKEEEEEEKQQELDRVCTVTPKSINKRRHSQLWKNDWNDERGWNENFSRLVLVHVCSLFCSCLPPPCSFSVWFHSGI